MCGGTGGAGAQLRVIGRAPEQLFEMKSRSKPLLLMLETARLLCVPNCERRLRMRSRHRAMFTQFRERKRVGIPLNASRNHHAEMIRQREQFIRVLFCTRQFPEQQAARGAHPQALLARNQAAFIEYAGS